MWKELCGKLFCKADEAETVTQEICDVVNEIYQCLHNMNQEEMEQMAELIHNYSAKDILQTVLFDSFAINLNPKMEWVEGFLWKIIQSEELGWQNLYFLYWQIKYIVFMDKSKNTKKADILVWKLLQHTFEKCKKEFQGDLSYIPHEERNPNLSILVVEQFLGEQHGPTKTTLDRGVILQNMGKKVLIINTAETFSKAGWLPFCGEMSGNYMPEYTNDETVIWKGIEMGFFQCEQQMPDISVLEMLIQVIRAQKPEEVIVVGGSSLLGGLINCIIPTLTVGLTASGTVPTLSTYQVVENQFVQKALENIKEVGYPESHIIPGRFTFSLRQQTEFVNRQQFDIPKEAFVLTCVGGRLDAEITDELLEMLEELADKYPIYFAVIGQYDSYEKQMEKFQRLKQRSINFGFCQDTLSRLELCDLYINPLRKGGGTSCVEAMAMGKPVVTLKFGDVYGSVEDDFACDDLGEMKARIIRYIEDKEFYNRHIELAKKKADFFLDSESEFRRILDEYKKRENHI